MSRDGMSKDVASALTLRAGVNATDVIHRLHNNRIGWFLLMVGVQMLYHWTNFDLCLHVILVDKCFAEQYSSTIQMPGRGHERPGIRLGEMQSSKHWTNIHCELYSQMTGLVYLYKVLFLLAFTINLHQSQTFYNFWVTRKATRDFSKGTCCFCVYRAWSKTRLVCSTSKVLSLNKPLKYTWSTQCHLCDLKFKIVTPTLKEASFSDKYSNDHV